MARCPIDGATGGGATVNPVPRATVGCADAVPGIVGPPVIGLGGVSTVLGNTRCTDGFIGSPL